MKRIDDLCDKSVLAFQLSLILVKTTALTNPMSFVILALINCGPTDDVIGAVKRMTGCNSNYGVSYLSKLP